MKIKFVAFLFIAVLFGGVTAKGQAWLWGEEGNAGLKASVTANNIVTNRNGNVFQTGNYYTSITFGIDTLVSLSVGDLFLVKYDKYGNVLWANTSLGDTSSYVYWCSVTSDDSDNSYVTGFGSNENGGVDTVTFGTYTLHLPYFGQMFIVKYNPNGKVVWAKQLDTALIVDGTNGLAITVDNFGHEYLTGDGAFLIKYDRNGNVIWTTKQASHNFLNTDIGFSVATDIYGNVYESGEFEDSLTFGNYQLYSKTESEFIAKYDSNGQVLWAQQATKSYIFGEYSQDYNCVAVDKSGAAYLTGGFSDTIKFGSYIFTMRNQLDYNFFVVKYNSDGTIEWGKQANPLNKFTSTLSSCSICSDDSSYIYISGIFPGTYRQPVSFEFANYTVSTLDTASNDFPSFLLKVDSSGNVICGSILSAGGISGNAITSDSSGKFVYLGGLFSESLTIGKTNLLNNTSGQDTYIGRWESCVKCNLGIEITPKSSQICSGQGVILIVPDSDLNYTWSPTSGLNSTTGDSVIANPTTTTTYTVLGLDSSGCYVTASDIITIIPAPNKPTITVSVTGDSLTSSAKSYNQWYFNDTLLSDSTPVLVIKGHAKGWYKVVVTNPANGCSTTSDSTTSINQLSVIGEQLSIYPNPFNNNITVKVSSAVTNIKNWNLQLTDVLGRRLYSMTSLSYTNEIDLSSLPGGMYFISVSNTTEREVFPIVKQN